MIGKKINQLATELAPVSTDLTIIGDPTTGVSKKITLAQLGAIFSGAVSFYTNLAAFPAVGDINVIYCAKDTQKLYLWSGSAYVEVFPSQALLNTYQLRSEKGNANGYASLDSLGKVPISQLPSSIMEYKGTWNASTNTPTLANGTGDTGDVYICNVAGTVNFGAGPITFAVGDYVIYSGTIWQRSSGSVGTVTSVAVSRSGDALAITGSPVTTSGTINIGFAGNSTQYINGAGNLVTFPGVINEAQNLITEVYNKTGATLTKGTVVYINGGQGNLPAVTKALATGDSTSAQTYGIVRNDITNNNNGYVVVAGRISDLDTQAYTEGTQLYLSSTTAGTYTSTKQYAPNHLVYVGIVVRAHPTQGVVEVKIQNGYEMDELHNVAAQTPSNNDGLFWEASTSLWKNKSIATILGYTPQAQLNGTGFVKASGTTISYDNSTYVTTDTFQTISASKTFSVGFSIASAGGTNQISVFQNTNSLFSGSGGSNVFGFNSANNIYFGKGLDNGGVLQWNNSAARYYTLPDATGTIALTSQLTGGTVTSVGLSSATSGVTIGSTPITTSGTITLAIATASGSQQGLLSSTDWNTFNNKQNALTNPVTGTGTSGQVTYFNGSTSVTGSNNFFWDATNNRLGINTNNPLVNLQVETTGTSTSIGGNVIATFRSQASGRAATIQFSDFTNSNYISSLSGSLGFGSAGTLLMTLNASGNLGLGTTSPTSISGYKILTINGSTGTFTEYQEGGTNTFRIGTDIGLGGFLFTQSALGIRFGTNDNEKMRLNASGNLSIGNTNNTFKLDVSGTGIFRGDLTLDSAGSDKKIYFRTSGGSPDTNWSMGNLLTPTGATVVTLAATVIDVFNGAGYGFMVRNTSNAPLLQIAGNTGAATFSSSVTAGGVNTFLSGGYNNTTYALNASISSNASASLVAPVARFSNNGGGFVTKIMFSDNNRGDAYITHVAGSAFTPSTRWLGFGVDAVDQMIINASGNVGIGTTAPNRLTEIVSSSGAVLGVSTTANGSGLLYGRIAMYSTAGSNSYIDYGGEIRSYSGAGIDNSDLRFYTANGSPSAERLRITNGGNVLIGTTTGDGYKLQIVGASQAAATFGQTYSTVAAYSQWVNSSGAFVMGLDGAAGTTERMRITSGGTVCVKRTTSPSSAYSMAIQEAIAMYVNANGNNMINFFNASETYVSSIVVNASSVAYNTSSDYRLKQDLKDFNGLDLLTKIKTYDYEWKSDKTRSYGVIAHELQSVINYAVTGVKDGEQMQGVDYSKIVPVLIKAIQELNDKIK